MFGLSGEVHQITLHRYPCVCAIFCEMIMSKKQWRKTLELAHLQPLTYLSQCYLPTHIPDCNGWRSGLPMKSDLGMEGHHHRDRRVQGCVGTDIALGSGSIRSMAQAYQVVYHRHGCSFSYKTQTKIPERH